mmetsp:Transcript_23817/g.3960  ORF Transcript_23817/g.3960 Transcript_23817/m.3960 type:complete len:106 (+) Transcript_23817:392-709(+)
MLVCSFSFRMGAFLRPLGVYSGHSVKRHGHMDRGRRKLPEGELDRILGQRNRLGLDFQVLNPFCTLQIYQISSGVALRFSQVRTLCRQNLIAFCGLESLGTGFHR